MTLFAVEAFCGCDLRERDTVGVGFMLQFGPLVLEWQITVVRRRR